jgi:hypothetical protein
MAARVTATHHTWELVAAFAFGVVFLSVILVLAVFRPNPTAFEYTVFRIVIALAAAGIGAILPGFLDVSFKKWLRAGGALGLLVVVYFFPPVAMPTPGVPPVEEPAADAKAPADRWLETLDAQQYRAAYDSMAGGFRRRYPYPQFEELTSRSRGALGALQSRSFEGVTPYESPPGAPKGAYRQYIYKSSYAGESRSIYEVIWLVGEQNAWRVSGFYWTVKSQNGQFVPYEAP